MTIEYDAIIYSNGTIVTEVTRMDQAHALQVETQAKRKELGAQLPSLAMRVFALQGKHYQGSGYHWTLVKTLGALLRNVNDYDSKFTWEDMMTNEVIYEDLVERVEDAERSIHASSNT